MSFGEKVRKVFRRHKSKQSASGIKIEYYRRHEVPSSKFKGPFDREHQKRLAAWSFKEAQAERPRSPDLSLSPCTTLLDYLKSQEVAPVAQNQAQPTIPQRNLSHGATPTAYHDEFIQDRQSNSLSSTTAVDPESFNDSTRTLFLDPLDDDDSVMKLKEPVRNASPPFPTKGTTPLRVAPEDLTRALNAVQICS